MSAHLASRQPASDRPALHIHALRKLFGDVAAVDGVDLTVAAGEFLTLLGPSGSGKTTTLRMIAGFTVQSSGAIQINGTDVSTTPPYKRDVGMVFQNYALFPHMTAAENIAFPLEMRKVPRPQITQRVAEALKLVKLEAYGPRYPRQMSGGQQQRIALARAVVFQPRLLLMDEPLGALDKKLREALQLEIMHISRELGATVLYVTHDQEEALVMSDRIAIFHEGKIEQLGTGEDLYERPASLFVADFIGESNILYGTYEAGPDGGFVSADLGRWRVSPEWAARARLASGATAALVVRPERLHFAARDADAPAGRNAVAATVTDALYLGSTRRYELRLASGQQVGVREQLGRDEGDWRPGDEVQLTWSLGAGVLVAGRELPADG